MIASVQKFVNNIPINVSFFRNINKGYEFFGRVFSVVGFEHSNPRFLAGILSGQRGRLAYCRQEAKCRLPLLPLEINNQGAWINER
ncbi:MAG: hypothetical protein KAS66_16155 [Candidatus Omnitrophica bacterium]|nr:hypothetical protein [Candidatus Omnitrophota bacterium]